MWDLGVLSFSPIIYHRKIRSAAEKLGIKPTEIYVFLDMSDITDEAIVYRVREDGTITMTPSHDWFDTGQFLLGNFATFRLLYNLWLDMPFGSAAPDESWRARWSLDPKIMDEWGRRGLELAGQKSGQDRRDLPGVEVPVHPCRLSLARQCQGGRSQQHPGHPLAAVGGQAWRLLRRWLCPILPGTARRRGGQVLHSWRYTFLGPGTPFAVR